MKILLVCLLSLLASDKPVWHSDYQKARITAIRSDKLVMINFVNGDAEDACKEWANQLFTTDAFKQTANKNLVLVGVEIPTSKHNSSMQRSTPQYNYLFNKYNPGKRFPFTVLIHPNGRKLAEWQLNQVFTADLFINELNHTINNYSTLTATD